MPTHDEIRREDERMAAEKEARLVAIELAIKELQDKDKADSEVFTRVMCDFYNDRNDIITLRLIHFYKRKKAYYKKRLIAWLQK